MPSRIMIPDGRMTRKSERLLITTKDKSGRANVLVTVPSCHAHLHRFSAE